MQLQLASFGNLASVLASFLDQFQGEKIVITQLDEHPGQGRMNSEQVSNSGMRIYSDS